MQIIIEGIRIILSRLPDGDSADRADAVPDDVRLMKDLRAYRAVKF
jgi:hypothetical protein